MKIGERLERFAAEKMPAFIGTVRRDGTAQMNPVWFEYADGYFWINGGPDRGWLRHVQRDTEQRITLLLVDPKNMWRWAQIVGRVVEVTAEGHASTSIASRSATSGDHTGASAIPIHDCR